MNSGRTVSITENIKNNGQLVAVYGIMALFLVLAEIMAPGFLNISHLSNTIRQVSFLATVSIGQTAVILAGGIDLSIASIITLANVVSAQMMNGSNAEIPVTIVIILGMGFVCGLINGIGVHGLKISPLIMTLAMGSVWKGAAYVYCKGAPKGATAPLIKTLVTGSFSGIPYCTVIWLIFAAIFIIILNKTVAGRAIFAIGTNREAARLSGVKPGVTTLGVYILSATMSALVGFLLIGYTGTSFLNTGDPYTMNSVAAVVIGGTSVAGGVGSYLGTIPGAVIMVIMTNILTVIKIPEFGRQIAQGLIILIILLVYGRGRKSG
jgi:ribose transport system permease protein